MVYVMVGFSYLVAIYAISTYLRVLARTQTKAERFECPYAPRGREISCLWSDGKSCITTAEQAKDCPLMSELYDAVACEEKESYGMD